MNQHPSELRFHDIDLKNEQQVTLLTPRRRPGFLAKALFISMDVLYGKKGSLSKFKVLEVIARVPYQAWENVAYIAQTHMHGKPGFARRIFEFVKEDLVQSKGVKESFLLHRFLPQPLAFFYYHISWFLYVINPRLSYALNADFEDHAEHEYMKFADENPELENEPFESDFRSDYGDFGNLADLFRQIALDERHHKEQSLERMAGPRFS